MKVFENKYFLIVLCCCLLFFQLFALYIFGQPFFCDCGYIKFWEGVVLSSGNSQHVTDWYTFSHIIHGIIFYGIFTLIFPRLNWFHKLLLAIGLEVSWEIIENTPVVIDHYRQQALAQGYTGDSILNSFFDTIAMVCGFFIALRSPIWFSASIILVMELFVGFMIRDNLTLNVINLIFPMDFIAEWQSR